MGNRLKLILFDPEKIHRLTLLFLKLFPFRKKKIYKNLKNEVFGLNKLYIGTYPIKL